MPRLKTIIKSLFTFLMIVLLTGHSSIAQQPTPTAQPPAQQLAFEVASIRQNKSGLPPTGDQPDANVPLGPGDVYSPTGGTFTATNFPLLRYIAFAYKMTDGQFQSFTKTVPEWVVTDRFNIQARTENQAVTKDQLRLMMRSILAERFKLAVHYETQQAPVFELVLAKPGTTGPKLQPHPVNVPCSNNYVAPALPDGTPAPEPPETIASGFPTTCGGILGMTSSAHDRYKFGARNVSMRLISTTLTNWGNLGRPILDATGLQGNYDFVLEFTPEGLQNTASDSGGPSFQEALKQQLGLKLESKKGDVNLLLLDHIEHLTEN